ncbi:MAG TPA: GGDEF domain-containing protein [Gammaproteobacteria bacterium]|nr:GGDEF domain-containing protein [Gammaproteobacteria bacterium]
MDKRDQDITTRQLAELPLFRGESPDALEWLVDFCRVESVAAGQVLLTPERHNDRLYIILAGRVEIFLSEPTSSRHTYLGVGACLGEMSIIEGAPPSATVITDTPCELLVIEGEALWSLINRSHAVARNLLYTLSQRVRRDNMLIVESQAQRRIFEQNAQMDALTGLHNRRWLDEMLARLSERCRFGATPLSLIMLDVDHFKAYNDTHGHLAGDRALQAIAQVIRANLRASDAAARYGGEEFVVIMPDTSANDARRVAERLCDAVRREPVVDTDGKPLPGVTISIGLASLEEGQDAEALLAAADAAMYRAKKGGRDRVAA